MHNKNLTIQNNSASWKKTLILLFIISWFAPLNTFQMHSDNKAHETTVNINQLKHLAYMTLQVCSQCPYMCMLSFVKAYSSHLLRSITQVLRVLWMSHRAVQPWLQLRAAPPLLCWPSCLTQPITCQVLNCEPSVEASHVCLNVTRQNFQVTHWERVILLYPPADYRNGY